MRRRELIARAGGWAAVAWAPAWLLGTSAALAFDSTKIGQWGSFILDDFQPILAKSAQLKKEVTAALAGRGGRTFETISDTAMKRATDVQRDTPDLAMDNRR